MPKNTTVNPTGVEIDGAKLRTLRKLSGQTMATFAQRCGIHLSYVSHIERGERNRIAPDKFAAICDALNIGADQRHTMLTPAARRRTRSTIKQAA